MPKYRVTVTERWTRRHDEVIVIADDDTDAEDKAVYEIDTTTDIFTPDFDFMGYLWETELIKEENDG